MKMEVGIRDACLIMTATITNRYEFIMKDNFGEIDCAAERASYLDITSYYNIPRKRMNVG